MSRARRRGGGPDRRPLERHVESLRAASRADEARLRAAIRPGRAMVSAEMLPIAEALADPSLGPGTLDAILASLAAAYGIGEGGLMCECATCREPWTAERVPRAALVIRLLEPAALRLAFVCEACAVRPPRELRASVVAMLRRDFLGGEGEEVTLAPGAGTA